MARQNAERTIAERSGGPGHGQGDGGQPPSSLVEDWITIWQSELSAAATDPELVQGWARLVALWATTARTAASFLPPVPAAGRAADAAAGNAGPAPPPRATPAAAAPDAGGATGQPDPRDAAIEHLARRVEELERRLAELAPRTDGR
jgi:hypothetical protein